MQPKVIQGDCIEVLPTLGKFNFIFADPPFNIGRNYDICNDRRAWNEYNEWCIEWVSLCWQHLEPDGVMCLHGNDTLAEIYLDAAGHLGFRQHRATWINWHYRFGQCSRSNWVDARCHCLVYACPGAPAGHTRYTWNPDAVLVPSDRAVVYGDIRVSDTERGGTRLPGTVWGIPSDGGCWSRVSGTNAERRVVHDNQLPENYLKRLILAYTNEGDSVLDPFGGSGTTITVAEGLTRVGTTIELSSKYCDSISERIKKGMVR